MALPAPPDPETERWIAAFLSQMTLEQKLGQVVTADMRTVTPEDVQRHHIGAIVDRGGAAAEGTDLADPEARLALADLFWLASTGRDSGGGGMAALFGMDGARGASGVTGAAIFPSSGAIAATGDAKLAERIGRITAREIRIAGQDWSWSTALPNAPSLDAAWAQGMQGKANGGSLLEGPYVMAGAVDTGLAVADPAYWRETLAMLTAGVRDGSIPKASVDAGATAMLRAKARLGLIAAPRPSQRYLAGRSDLLSAGEHKSVAREAVRRSLVLLKDSGLLPIIPTGNLLVAGHAAIDITVSLGAWAAPWSSEAAAERFPYARTIYYGLRQAMLVGGGSADWSAHGSYSVRPDAGIVVVEEGAVEEGRAIIRRLRADNIPTIALLLTEAAPTPAGALSEADAMAIVWQPGSEGGGVADLLIGDGNGQKRWQFTGRLPEGP